MNEYYLVDGDIHRIKLSMYMMWFYAGYLQCLRLELSPSPAYLC